MQRLVGPLGIVVGQPLGPELAHVGQRAKQVRVEQFTAKRAVEAVDIGVLSRLARLNPVQGTALLRTLLAQPGAATGRAVVGAQLRGAALALA